MSQGVTSKTKKEKANKNRTAEQCTIAGIDKEYTKVKLKR